MWTVIISTRHAECLSKRQRTQLNNVPNEPHDQEAGADSLADLDELALVGYT
jgi:hypothetical protein